MSAPRAGYLGPPGTFSEEALRTLPDARGYVPTPLATVRETVMAVHQRSVDRALAPIENSLEGAVNPTLDALAFEADDVRIAAEVVHPVRHRLLAAGDVPLERIAAVVSHPQATAQCARWLREHVPNARLLAAPSTADAVRSIAEGGDPTVAAIGTRLAGELYGCRVLVDGIEDAPDNTTRFVWLAPARDAGANADGDQPMKTSVVFWGAGTGSPGWLVRCLSEFAFRGVNLTRIESRPLKRALGEYVFFADLDGGEADAAVAGAIEGLRSHASVVKVLGSYPAAPGRADA